MNLRWGIFAQCINEKELIEAKIEWALRLGMEVSICEGHHPNYKKFNPDTHLSNDGTTEILESYSGSINYVPAGEVPWQGVLRDKAYKALPNDLDVVIMSDIDEFYLEKDLDLIDDLYAKNKDLKLTVTNGYIFLDDEHCAPYYMPTDGAYIEFNTTHKIIQMTQWHERIFRYNKYYSYLRSPFIINDIYGRFIFNDSVYFNERELLPNIYQLHYKNFKMQEQKERHEMYKRRGDTADYNLEQVILEKNKFKYNGEHPIEIQRILNGSAH